MLTDSLSRFRFGSLRSLSPRRFRISSTSETPEIQSAPALPAFQMDYTVSGSDTLERIAASHDCTVGELMKLNRMSSRMVFPGQKIIVPVPSSDDVFEQAKVHQASSSQQNSEGIRRGPGGAVPAQKSVSRTGSAPSGSTEENDSDCLQRFLKIKAVKQVTESDGTVSGTLLVTPNCLMFDPDVTHPLVKEKGPDLYGMVANLDEIVSVSVYKELAGLTGDRSDKKRDIFDPSHVRTAQPSVPSVDVVPDDPVQEPPEKVSFTCEPVDFEEYDSAADEQLDSHSASSKLGSELQLPSITEEHRTTEVDSPEDVERKRAISDVTNEKSPVAVRSRSPSASRNDERPRSFSELDAPPAPQGISRFSPNAARRSFGKLGRTLSERAKSVSSSVAKGTERVAQTAVQGTKTVAHGVVTHTRSAADSLQTGLETGVKVVGAAANQAKAAADAVAAVPGRVVDIGTNLVSDGINGVQEMFTVEEQRSASQMKREQSLATLEGLKLRTQQARDDARNRSGIFSCATSTDEMPDLFMPVDQMIGRTTPSGAEASSPVLPYYMAVRLTRKRKPRKSSPAGSTSVSSYDEDVAFGNKLKREFWFAIPRNKADNIYHFLLQWSPEKYGQDTTLSTTLDDTVSTSAPEPSRDRGFIILDSTADESLAGDEKATPFGSSLLNREWELVTVSEMCRRLSLDDLDQLELPIPEGASSSQVLDELMIRQIMEILPPRAEGYPWVNIYNSEKHGFSLATLYRKMIEFDEDLSPVLLIIRDTNEHVFGAVVSGAIRPSDHYTGTGDSCLLWRFTGAAPHTRELRQYTWTGDNQFFVNAAKDSLSVGAGGGHYGLWLDADLNHGRSQRCDTFDNEPLAGEKEDFIVQFVEAYGFRM